MEGDPEDHVGRHRCLGLRLAEPEAPVVDNLSFAGDQADGSRNLVAVEIALQHLVDAGQPRGREPGGSGVGQGSGARPRRTRRTRRRSLRSRAWGGRSLAWCGLSVSSRGAPDPGCGRQQAPAAELIRCTRLLPATRIHSLLPSNRRARLRAPRIRRRTGLELHSGNSASGLNSPSEGDGFARRISRRSVLAGLPAAAALRAQERPPNFLVIVADDHGWDDPRMLRGIRSRGPPIWIASRRKACASRIASRPRRCAAPDGER